jgi:hypothetical protein
MNTVFAAILALAIGALVAGCAVPTDGAHAGKASATQLGVDYPNGGSGGGGGGGGSGGM